MLLFRQIVTLVYKNILIALLRRPFTTPLRALLLPVVFGWFVSYAKNFFIPPATFGFGSTNAVRGLQDALSAVQGHSQVVFVDNGFKGGEIERLIDTIGGTVRASGKSALTVSSEDDLLTVCKSSLRGSTDCVAAVVFYSSPNEPEGAGLPYNYTLRFDGALGDSVSVDSNSNDQQLYVMPLQHAIDDAIANINSTVDGGSLVEPEEYAFTDLSQDERATKIRVNYMHAVIKILAVAFFIGICGIQYQQVGAQATERESKMAQLVEVMMPNRRRWEPQLARLLSYHVAFSLIYLPGWIIMAIILHYGVFLQTSIGIVIITHLLLGLSLASFSLFAASFFKKAQLSGITTILISLVLAIIAQVYYDASNAAVIVCSLLFPSMNYTYMVIFMARFEAQDIGTNLVQSAPDNPWSTTGIVLWVFLIIQIVVYPILAALVERGLWGTTSSSRRLTADEGVAVRLEGFSKHFHPSWFHRKVLPLFSSKKRETVLAVDDLSLSVRSGQISVLLGANGSGKSTTLDAIAGLSRPTAGAISLDFRNGLGLCPQQNVLWKDLSVYEHVHIFNRLKSIGATSTKQELENLIDECDLKRKIYSRAESLSGGQMRKLQLAAMFTGDSRICLIDECSSGIDPIARKKIQTILLEERRRSNRTMIFTSHYLDEADIADYILIMSKGKLKIHGTAPEIKQSGQYRIHVYHNSESTKAPRFDDIPRQERFDQTIYTASDSASAAKIMAQLDEAGYVDYTVSGPTIEDAFMQVAEEMVPSAEKTIDAAAPPDTSSDDKVSEAGSDKALRLTDGSQIGPLTQGFVLFRKRFQVFLRNVYPNLAVLLLIPIAAGLTSLFLKGFGGAGCSPIDQVSVSDVGSLSSQLADQLDLVVGPSSSFNQSTISLILSTLWPANSTNSSSGQSGSSASSNLTGLLDSVHLVDTLDEFNNYIRQNYHNVTPGGFFLGENGQPPTMAWLGDGSIAFPIYVQNMLDSITTNIPITTQYAPFDIPWQAGQGNTLQFIIYFALVTCIAPAFLSLYPTLERLRHVRGLHYSNGVRALPLWLSYTVFDFLFILVGASVAIIILAAGFHDVLFSVACLWLVIVLFGLCATLFSYVVSLYAASQLGAFAVAAAYQAVSALLYMIAYLSTFTYAPIYLIDHYLNIVHFTLSVIFPSGSLLKSLFVSLNVLSVNCRGTSEYVASPGDITAYGGPIAYLTIQSLLLFAFLVWWESGNKLGGVFKGGHKLADSEEKNALEPEVQEELARVAASESDGLKVIHLTKAYGSNVAVDDVSFGVKSGEVFGLLGPNGAGKSTTISVVRGDLKPSNREAEVLIENISLRKKKAVARQHLSACPQHDAMDRLTVTEHLQFYARIRGVKEVKHNVDEVIRAVGLDKFRERMGEALSGGNKRKLSLGIALMGNPAVMLLDEPSSGMDVAAKRVMWRTLEAVVPGRSIVLTTHSMEEADRLCSRAGILARRMLAVGTSDYLRKKHGDRYYVHMLLRSAPHTSDGEAERVRTWIESEKGIPGAAIEGGVWHGQVRFSVPSTELVPAAAAEDADAVTAEDVTPTPAKGGIGALFQRLESCKEELGFEYYSVSQTSLDQVFLSIVGKHHVEEENAGSNEPPRRRWWRMGTA